MKKTIILLIVLLCFSTIVVAQDTLSMFTENDMLSLVTKIEIITQNKMPKWKLEEKTVYATLLSIRWSSDEGHVLVSLEIAQTVDVSKAEYKRIATEFGKGMDAKVSRTELTDLGDEGYLWSGYNDSGMSRVLFRKGEAVIRVFAPSPEVTKRFAQYVADRIPPVNKNSESQAALTIEEAHSKLNQFVGRWRVTYDIPNWGKTRSDPTMPKTPLRSEDSSREITIVRSDPTTISFSFSVSVLHIAAAKTTTESCEVKLKYDAQLNKYLLTIRPSFGVVVVDLPLGYSENVFSGTGRNFAATKGKGSIKRSKEMNLPASASIIFNKEGESIWEIKAGQLLMSQYIFAFSRK